ncbi:MAG TPA: hypothetical protein EYG53_05045 [Gammaproteobacteria bacterium]|nr:hypothetical protein [Gammaproteobacteria bacterium]
MGSALSTGVAALILGTTTSVFVADVATEVMMSGPLKAMNMDSCAPDNFQSLLGQLSETDGWLPK